MNEIISIENNLFHLRKGLENVQLMVNVRVVIMKKKFALSSFARYGETGQAGENVPNRAVTGLWNEQGIVLKRKVNLFSEK